MIRKISLWGRVVGALLLAVTTVTYFPVSNANADSVSWASGGPPTAGSIVETKESLNWCKWQKGIIYNNPTPQDICIGQGEGVRFGYSSSNQPLLSVGDDESFYAFSGAAIDWRFTQLIPGTDTLVVGVYVNYYVHGLSIFKNLSEKITKNGTTYELTPQADFTLRNSDNTLVSVKNFSYSQNGDWIVMNTDTGTIRMNVQNYDLHVFAESSGGNTVYLSISDDGEHAVRLIHGMLARVYDIDVSCGSADITQTLNLSQSCPSADFSSLISTFGNDNYIWPSAMSFSPSSKMFTVYYWVQAEGQYKFVDIYVPGYNPVDVDDDELTLAQESAQGTSDNIQDNDNDGLRDDIESRWYPNRNDIFCGATECAYPNPIKKDLYVEVDWIYQSARDYKPTSAQIAKVIDVFDEQDIIAHFDTSQYGGGAQLPASSGSLTFVPESNKIDFYDLKNGTSTVSANFEPNRRNIWRYMVTGPNFLEYDNNPGTTGISFAGDDDSMVSIEKIEDENPLDVDTAIAGTMLHELGHNLCLSDSSMYTNHALECIYSEIDKDLNDNPSINYESVMNYRYQLSQVDYSHGVNGILDDHDDWFAVSLGINDFVTSPFEYYNTQNKSSQSKNQIDRSRMINAIQR